jgi:twitching motility protein PilT
LGIWNLEELLNELAERGGSDLLLTAGAHPQFRINRLLVAREGSKLMPQDTREMAYSMLNEKQIAAFEERRSIDLSRSMGDVARFRLNIYYQRGSISIAARLIPYTIPGFEELGLPDVVRDFALHPHGLVLVTGPAGMGKSTTLASMIDYINRQRYLHIVTIEDPIEYVHHHHCCLVDQREILQDASSFDEALRSVFRQSPDVILVGEMRDLETIRLALNLAETGHLIMATLHTHDTTNAIQRIVSVFPSGQQQQVYTQLSMTLVGVLSQCLLVTSDRSNLVLAYEVLRTTPAVRNLIREQQTQQIYSLIQTGKDDAMITMNESLKTLCEHGLITEEIALEKSPRPKELARMLQAGGLLAVP